MRYICSQVLGHGGLSLALTFSLFLQALHCTKDGFCFISFFFKQNYLMDKRENISGDMMLWQDNTARLPLCGHMGQDLVPPTQALVSCI